MSCIKKYNEARKSIESRFLGLPHLHTTLVKSLITLADPTTGIVSNISYYELSKLLTVDPAPGRKGAGMPQKETIRSYLRTIADNCPEDFRLISQGQKLRIQFTMMPKIFANFLDQEKEYTDVNGVLITNNPMKNIENIVNLEELDCSKTAPDKPIENFPIENINILTNKQNNNTHSASENLKRFITSAFKPTQETIDIALGRGLTKVTDKQELQKFIEYNQNNNCLWADFNPVFLNWLERGNEYQQLKKQQMQNKGYTRSGSYERTTHKNNSYTRIMEQVRRDNMDACAPSESLRKQGAFTHLFEVQPHILALDSAHANIRPTFS